MTKSIRAPGKRTADSAITRSLILSAIEAGATYAQAARDAGVSPARARQVAKEAGLPARHPGGLRSEAVTTRTARGAAILARVVELAAAASVEPEAWLGDAAWTLAAHARAAAELDHLAEHGSTAERAVAGSVPAANVSKAAATMHDVGKRPARRVRAARGAVSLADRQPNMRQIMRMRPPTSAPSPACRALAWES